MVAKSWKMIVVLLAISFILGSQAVIAASEQVVVTRKDMLDVAKEIHPPGCTDSMTADYCTLATAYDTRDEIWKLLQQGMSKQEVLDVLVNKYGERILASPARNGFNLIAWVLPGISIIIGGLVIAFLIRRWIQAKSVEPAPVSEADISPEMQKKVDEELKNWF